MQEPKPQQRIHTPAEKTELDHPVPQPDSEGKRVVYLPTLLSTEFGISEGAAWDILRMGVTEIDGERWMGDPLNVPYKDLYAKELVVIGDTRHFKMIYKPFEGFEK